MVPNTLRACSLVTSVRSVLVRASGTENIIRVMVEAAEEDVASKFAKDISNLVKSKS